jgi:MFS family permease
VPRKTLVLVACILGSGMAFLDGTVVNVALPAMASDLGAGLATQQWVVEAYLLTLASFLLIGGSLGDLFGHRRVCTWPAWRPSEPPRCCARSHPTPSR